MSVAGELGFAQDGPERAGWRMPTRAEVAKGAADNLTWHGEKAAFYVWEDKGRCMWLGRIWSTLEGGWNLRADPFDRMEWGFPAWAGMTRGDATAVCETIDRLMVEGLSLRTIYRAMPTWAGEDHDAKTHAEQAVAEELLRAAGWAWPVEPRPATYPVEVVDPLPGWAFEQHFPASPQARPWMDVGCERCGVRGGEPCRGRFAADAERAHKQRASLAKRIWDDAEEEREARGVPEGRVGEKTAGVEAVVTTRAADQLGLF